MEYIIILLLLIVTTLLLGVVLNMNVRKIKDMTKNQELDELVKRFPDNVEVCKSILKKLNNETVIIEESEESKTNLYIAISNKIVIANIKDSYSRIQTIAHECLHSVQNRKLLLFNFLYSNGYLLYWIGIIILRILKIIQNDMLQVAILSILSGVYYFVRSYLENDAMIKAKYVAKEYIEENEICTELEKENLIAQYDKINSLGIPLSNFSLLFNTYRKIALYVVVCIVMNWI